ncbi:MAG TPA: peptidase M28, partial [Rhodopirellula sp.]|nr:peptidase M28 [Rhodopirellula sp.]
MESKPHYSNGLTVPQTLASLSFCFLFITSQAFAQTDSDASLINEASIRGHVRFLADDLLEGRGPGSRGDELTQLYISTQFEALGLQPAAGNGEWLQPFPLVGVRTIAPPNVVFKNDDKTVSLKSVEDFMSTIGRPAEQARLQDAELVFVGYGIEAPEYGWDDYKDVDLTGKVLVMMNNDP